MTVVTETRPAVRFEDVCIVFGDKPTQALPLMDAGQSREEIQDATGQVLGVHACSLDVMEGEIVVLMGLSGSGKSTLLRAVNGLNPVSRGAVLVDGGDQGVIDVATADAQVVIGVPGSQGELVRYGAEAVVDEIGVDADHLVVDLAPGGPQHRSGVR